MIVKVKEPLPAERKRLRRGQVLFTYLHLAPDPRADPGPARVAASTGIAYETVTSPTGGLPLLTPMSEVAGRLAPQVGAHCLEKAAGGRGMLLGGVPGVPPAEVVVLGGGVVGHPCGDDRARHGRQRDAWSTARPTCCAGSRRSSAGRAHHLLDPRRASASIVRRADLLIGAVLVPGAAAPKLVTRDMVKTHEAGLASSSTSPSTRAAAARPRTPTTHSDPTYVVDGVIHYCVANMPGAVARTSTFALNNATLPFTLALADKGWRKALADDPHLRNGLNVHDGKVTCKPVAEAQGLAYVSAESLLGL